MLWMVGGDGFHHHRLHLPLPYYDDNFSKLEKQELAMGSTRRSYVQAHFYIVLKIRYLRERRTGP